MRASIVICAALFACGGKEPPPAEPAESRAPPLQPAPAPAPEPAPAPAPAPAPEPAPTPEPNATPTPGVPAIPPLTAYRARLGCDAGDAAACIARADEERELDDRIRYSIYTLADVPGVDPLASNRKACTLGSWKACAFVADRNRDLGCDEPLGDPDDTPDAALVPEHDRRAHELAEAACDGGEAEACRFVGLRAIAGCGRPRDEAFANARLERALASPASRCATGLLDACAAVDRLCAATTTAASWARSHGPADAAPTLAPIPVREAVASSVLPPWKGYRFSAAQLVDGDLTTSWQPLDKRRGGVGQWFELRLPAGALVAGLDLANGLQKRDALGDLFVLNNRVAHARIELSDGTDHALALAADRRGFHEVRWSPRAVTWIRVHVEAIHRGTKWNDLAVSEVRVVGTRDEPASARLPAACAASRAVSLDGCRAGSVAACRQHLAATRIDDALHAEARARVVEALTRRCEADGGDAPEVARACALAGEHTGGDDDADRRAARLVEKACRMGDHAACGNIGCHGRDEPIDGVFWDDRFGEAAAGVCEAACERGDDTSCLALGGAVAFDAAGIDLNNPWVHKVSARARASCGDADSCLAAGEQIGAEREVREPLGLADFVNAQALFEKACVAGSVTGCDRLQALIDDWGDATSHLRLRRLACQHGSATACEQLAREGEASARRLLADAVASLAKRCEDQGDPEVCLEAAAYVAERDPSEGAALRRRASEFLDKRCKDERSAEPCLRAADVNEDEAASRKLREQAITHAARSCAADGKGCVTLCEALPDVIEGDVSFIGEDRISIERLAPLTSLTPGLSAEALRELCMIVALSDECACGCC